LVLQIDTDYSGQAWTSKDDIISKYLILLGLLGQFWTAENASTTDPLSASRSKNSGNLIVDAGGDADDVRGLLEGELATRFGFTVDVTVRATADWEHSVATNPFASDADAMPKMVHLYLSRDSVKSGAAKVLEQRVGSGSASSAERSGSTMVRRASAARISARSSSTRRADRRRLAATGTAC
jgi:Protein of unknown function (DUF1697)